MFSFKRRRRGRRNRLLTGEQSNLTISDIHISNMYGTTSEARDPNVGTIVCSSPDVSFSFFYVKVFFKEGKGICFTNERNCIGVLGYLCREH